ncbi:MAG: DNA mismatch repair endonuclease MutL [Planctomycetes bacterium]|nr:DNA mismatch repair endonuclease MutL [Planctomycetota bacterium]
MGRIHQLPMSVVNRIAAGEVVERPASVVKELLENALDASPSRIDVALDQGGIALVRVVDDGGGIEADDLPLAVTAHATSKLRVAEDLERIGTLGFRGEALASIAEVSRLVIRSRTPDGTGATITVDGGRADEVRPDGCAVGTTVEVHQLFGNVPARRSFLRAPQTEWSHASEAFVRTALAHPAVAFSLLHNGRRVHDLPATNSWRDRIAGLFGAEVAGRLIEVEADDGEVSVHGFVGRPEDDVASGRLQHLFVGGRPFRDRSILHAVQEAYRGLLLSGRQPIAFLAFDLPPDAVDVNVHPAKMEVRFREPSRLYRLVLSALRTKFLAANVTTRLEPPRPAVASLPEFEPFAPTGLSGGVTFGERIVAPAPRTLWPTEPAAGDREVASRAAGDTDAGLPAWEMDDVSRPGAGEELAVQMHDRYIVVETASGIEVIDQHALHERLLYEKFKAAVEAGGLEVQPLLVPEKVDLAPADLELVHEHAGTLERAGMKIEPFGGSTVIVTSKPALAGDTPAAAIVREVLDRLSSTAAAGGGTSVLVDEVLHGLACRAAIKAGDRLSQAEVDALVRDRRIVSESHHCPHGRPTSLTLSRQDLDRQFRRT